MILYYSLLLGVVSVGAGSLPLADTSRRRLVVWLCFGAIAAITGLRSLAVGKDTFGYMLQYEVSYEREDEAGYSLLNKISTSAGLGFHAFLLLIAVFVTGVVALLICRYSMVPWQSFYLHITMGLFAMSMSGIRQSVAAAIAILAILQLFRGRRLLFAVLILIAYSFHNSAIVLLPLALIYHVKLDRKAGAVVLVATGLVATQQSLTAAVVHWIGLAKYDVYLDQGASINPLVILVALVVPVACWIMWPESPQDWNRGGDSDRVSVHSVLFIMAALNFACVALGEYVPIMTRLTYYFVTFSAILIPNTIARLQGHNIRLLANAALLALPLLMFIYSVPHSSLGVAPYRSMWAE